MLFRSIELPYSFDALEPHIDALTMETHYSKHHAAYTKVLNEAAEKAGVLDTPIEVLLASLGTIQDEALRQVIRNNGGGFYNHNLYFSIMSPNPAPAPEGVLKAAIERGFGDVDSLKDQLKKAALGRFGSGWAWLNSGKKDSGAIYSPVIAEDVVSEESGTTWKIRVRKPDLIYMYTRGMDTEPNLLESGKESRKISFYKRESTLIGKFPVGQTIRLTSPLNGIWAMM